MVSLVSVVDGFIFVLSKIRPIWFKQKFFSFIFSLSFLFIRFKSIVLQIKLPVFLVSGVRKNSTEQIRFLFASRGDFPLFLIELLFEGKPQVEEVGRVFIWKMNMLNRFSYDADAVFVSCDQFYRRFLHQDNFFVFPHMVDMVLDCNQGLDQIMENMSLDAKREIKKVKNQDFSFEITSDGEKVSKFYYDMYKPMVENRIGKTDMFIPGFLAIRFFLQMGCELMLTLLDGSYVCGSFFHHQNDVLKVKYFGISQGNIDLYKRRVSAADQYFIILVGLDRKVSYVDYGGARPFFSDGLFYYKLKWGTSIEPYSLVPDVFGLRICNKRVLKPFLLKNPFIGLSRDDQFIAYVFVDKETFAEDKKEDVEKQFKKPGIDDVRFIKL